MLVKVALEVLVDLMITELVVDICVGRAGGRYMCW